MLFIPEEISAGLVSHELAYDAARRAYLAAVSATSFPVVHGHGSDAANRFTVKSAATDAIAGVKIGSYFPGNAAQGLPRHNSLILLFDQATGRIGAAIQGGELNAYRTAAGDAVATDCLARPEARVLTLFGTGHQAGFEVAAVARVRALSKVFVVGREAGRSAAMVARLQAMGLDAEAAEAEPATRAADIILTATASRAPLFEAEWVRPGTHVSSMGSDAPGKQELPPALLPRARLFCDLPAQSARIGEFQHAPEGATLTAIGAVLAGAAPGRTSPEEITVFDSSGLSIQDLTIGQEILERYLAGPNRS